MSSQKLSTRRQLGIAGRSELRGKSKKSKKKSRSNKPSGSRLDGVAASSAGPGFKADAPGIKGTDQRPVQAGDVERRVHLAKRELTHLHREIERAEIEFDNCVRARKLELARQESVEERELRQKIALLKLRQKAVRAWLAKHTKATPNEQSASRKKRKGGKGSKRAAGRRDRRTKGVSSSSGRRRATLFS